MFRYDLTQTMLKIYKVALILVVSIRVSGLIPQNSQPGASTRIDIYNHFFLIIKV